DHLDGALFGSTGAPGEVREAASTAARGSGRRRRRGLEVVQRILEERAAWSAHVGAGSAEQRGAETGGRLPGMPPVAMEDPSDLDHLDGALFGSTGAPGEVREAASTAARGSGRRRRRGLEVVQRILEERAAWSAHVGAGSAEQRGAETGGRLPGMPPVAMEDP